MGSKPPKKSCGQVMEGFQEFMWNPRTKEFMGRTGTSWALILLFYLVFYAFLTALFSLTMWVMLQTIDDYTPKYTDRLANPGLMIRPQIDNLEIVYNLNDSSSWNGTVTALNTFLSKYNDTNQALMNDNCPRGFYYRQQDSGDVRNHPKKACQFNRSSLALCSGENDTTYGYSSGKPCVLIKLNRVVNFEPKPKRDGQGYVTVNCSETVKSGETSNLMLTYFPSNGTDSNSIFGIIDLMYYPFYGKKAQTNYSQPIVAVQFSNVTTNIDHNIKCAIYANNIDFEDRDKFAGRVNFKIRVNI
ncbi:sodium/potassium-transporting ATPase subunit beta-2 [Ambystoma mexicanum]|uniref:sodium/potassium-transporting ATPase subunit beta-2 n=1 Tax=Ambystoma mexicanum TaxID=8296 RepID=UPI0037E743E9